MKFNHGIGSFLGVLCTALSLGACDTLRIDPVPEVKSGATLIPLAAPAHFPSPVYIESNPLTEEGVLLGKMLFFDPKISANGTVSCASCHEPKLAFSDGVAIPQNGVSGKALERHSPVLFNLAWIGNGLFWDGGSKNLESQAFGPLTHADEMGMDMTELEDRLREGQTYTELFESAFEDGVTAPNTAKALAQFERTLISATSKYDQSLNPSAGVRLTESELKGLTLVKKHCAACHEGELFTDNKFHNNGIDDDFSDESHEMVYLGRYRISHAEADRGAFKTPSLRNSMISAPYMHDGRFETIDQVLDHYSGGVIDAVTTSPLLYQTNGKAGIPLSDLEKSAIKDFLHALTDWDFVNKDWADTH